MKVNDTPVRTCRNFKINNIEIEDVDVNLSDTKEFQNVIIESDDLNIKLNKKSKCVDLEYGLSKDLEKEVNDDSNYDLDIQVIENSKEVNKIIFNFDDNNKNLISKINILVKKNKTSSFVIILDSKDDLKFYSNILINLVLKENSNVDILLINLLNNKSINLMSLQNTLYEKSNLDFKIVDFGGKYSITNYFSNLIGNSSENNLSSIYIGGKDEIYDLNYISHLKGEKSKVDIKVEGTLKDNAKKNFKGTIDFKKGCKKASGNEEENCILLSDEAKSIALPMLLCSEEDVEGNHSTSAGKCEEKELFYIMSRGFSIKEAEKLLVRAKFNKVIEKIKDEKVNERVLKEIDKRLD